MSKAPLNLVTHNARFHSDDVFASAVFMMALPNVTITRTRDQATIDAADGVFDVGGVHNPETLRFDHHQPGGAGIRPNGIPYASFGLVWKHFGEKLSGSKQVADRVDEKLVQPIDAMDNGIDLYTAKRPDLHPYIFQTITFSFNPTWNESDTSIDGQFFDLVSFAQKILVREIKQAIDQHEAEGFIRDAYERAANKQIIELDRNYPWGEFMAQVPEPLYVVRQNVQDSFWKVEAVKDNIYSYTLRKPMPKAWAGKRGAELAKVTGVFDAVFCHNGCFLAVAKSREGALKLAQLAVEA